MCIGLISRILTEISATACKQIKCGAILWLSFKCLQFLSQYYLGNIFVIWVVYTYASAPIHYPVPTILHLNKYITDNKCVQHPSSLVLVWLNDFLTPGTRQWIPSSFALHLIMSYNSARRVCLAHDSRQSLMDKLQYMLLFSCVKHLHILLYSSPLTLIVYLGEFKY